MSAIAKDQAVGATAAPSINPVKVTSIGLPFLYFLLFFVGPLIYLGLLGFWTVDNFSIVPSFSLANYAEIASNLTSGSKYGFAIAQTLYVSATTAILAVLVCYPMALAVAYAVPERYQRLIVLLSVAPFWTSYILRVYAWQVLLAKRGVINSLLAYAGLGNLHLDILYTQTATRIGLVHYLAPILIVILYISVRNVDGTLIEAARELGASRQQVLTRVILPLTRPGIILSLSFAALVACGDVLSGSILGGGAGESVLGKLPLYANLVIRAYASSTNLPHTAAMAIVLVALMLLIVAIGLGVGERTRIAVR